MRTRILLLLVLLLAAPLGAATYPGKLTIDATARSLTYGTNRHCRGRLETASVRLRYDGTAPTATEGELIEPGDIVTISGADLANAQFIRTGGTSGVLPYHCWR